jgi:hypothetical protein
MNLSNTRHFPRTPQQWMESLHLSSGTIFTLIICLALLSFEIFNYSTTDYALRDLLGDPGFIGLRWSTILAMAFCAMDLAGLARLLSLPADQGKEKRENWFLLGAWLVTATMNACLTWWGISMAIYNHPVQSIVVVDPMTIVTVVPVFVAVMVWIIRILIIGSLVTAFNRMQRGYKSAAPQARQGAPLGFKIQPPVPGSATGFVRKPMPPTATQAGKLPESYIAIDRNHQD